MSGTTEYSFGRNTVEALLRHTPERLYKVFFAQELRHDRRLKALIDQAQHTGVTVQFVPRAKLDSWIPKEDSHQGVVAMVAPKPLWDLHDLLAHVKTLPPETPPLLVMLDGVTDAHNFGALIRVAAAANATAIIVPKMGSAGFSPVVGTASAGTLSWFPIAVVPNLVDAMERLKTAGVWWVGTGLDATAKAYTRYDFKGPVGLVLGSEDKGMRRLVREHCDEILTIPMNPKVASLNVSVASGVLLFEAARQRNYSS